MQQAVDQRRKGKKRCGFTLLEMMIVLGLVIVLTTATAVYNKGIGRQIVVAREHAKVLGILIKARSAGFTIPKTDPLVEVVCGYGVHVDPPTRTLVFFKDLGVVGASCGTSANNRYDGADERIEQIGLDSSVTMASPDMSDVVFIPPFGKVVIDNSDTKTRATITINGVSTDMTKKVNINSYGQITE